MSQNDAIKLIPRNTAALRRGQTDVAATRNVVGNPVSTRLESGVGNCFPGLEFDLRNLERRFFPFLEVDISDTSIRVVGVDTEGLNSAIAAGSIDTSSATTYRTIAADVVAGNPWSITSLTGTFGPLGNLTLNIGSLRPAGQANQPPDAWTAIRLLTETTPIQIELQNGSDVRQLTGNRARYLDDNGALASMFLPGEMTQSLCSPWTHDFRDCGCFYWASNHPDIAQPPVPDTALGNPDWNIEVPWERSDRTPDTLPQASTANSPNELDHYEINRRWQELNFVVEGREQITDYIAIPRTAVPFTTPQELEDHLRYAAGVELAVIHLYLAAAYSFRSPGATGTLAGDITASHAELMRVAFGEMRHLRAVNDVLASIAHGNNAQFVPALRVARTLPGQAGAWSATAATPDAVRTFVTIEAPSVAVDGLYSRILATLERDGTDDQVQTIRSIMAEGEDHFETFEFMQEWLGRHQPVEYLRSVTLAPPPATDARHRRLQQVYQQILQGLYEGYRKGLPAGAQDINSARSTMVAVDGLAPAAQAVADAGFLVVFDELADARFTPVDLPPA